MNKKVIALFSASLLLLTACSKEKDSEPEGQDFSEPAEEEVLTGEKMKEMENEDIEITKNHELALDVAKRHTEQEYYSYQSLVDQLTFEGFHEEEARYAADNVEVNWDENAKKLGEQYLEEGSFKLDELRDQLVYEGFTEASADYAVDELSE